MPRTRRRNARRKQRARVAALSVAGVSFSFALTLLAASSTLKQSPQAERLALAADLEVAALVAAIVTVLLCALYLSLLDA